MLIQNLRYGVRQLRKSPAFTTVAVLTLALGIGANTAIFSVVHAVLLAPLPYPNADRLVAIQSNDLKQGFENQPLSPAGFRELEKQVSTFENIAAGRYNYVNLTRVEKPTQLTDHLVTQNYFEVLGVRPMLGRTFTRQDAAAAARPTVVLGYNLWQTQFGGRSDILDQTITLDDEPHVVIGVMAARFKEPTNNAALWRVLPNEGGENFAATSRFWNVIGRLRDDVTHPAAQAELSTIAARLAQSDPKFYADWGLMARPLRDAVVGNYRDGLVLVVGAALLVLLITCANVAGLQLVRASTRGREIAVRLALGASRSAIAHSVLAESILLVLLGGIGGVLLGSWGLDILLATISRDWIPRNDEIAVNLPVLTITGAFALLSGLLSGLYPAWQATRVHAIDSLHDGSKGSAGQQSVRLRGILVVAQIALTVVLLVCAGLVWKSFSRIMAVNPGINVENTLSLTLSLAPTRYDTPEKRIDYFRQLLERVQALPGIQRAGFTQTMPFTWGIPGQFTIEGRPDSEMKLPPAFYDSVSPSYFATMGVPLLAGRNFTENDDLKAPRVVLISQATAKKFFPGENPIGKRLFLPPQRQQSPVPLEIIGVVGDVAREGLDAETPYQVYASLLQRSWAFATLVVRSPLPVETLTRSVEREIWSLNPEQPITNVAPVKTLVKTSLTQPQLYLTLFSSFAALATLLAGLGLYGLVAYSVAQRTREFGIRLALGAQVRNLLSMVIGQGARLTVAGLVAGFFVSLVMARLIQSLLFQTSAYDPVVFTLVALLLSAIALLAALLPAFRATKTDPVKALRSE